MGTTSDALETGSFSYCWVAVVEGYEYLLTNGPTDAVVTAFGGSDWTQALGGLFVDLNVEQSINPYEPFGGGGSCTLHVVPDAADTFGIATHRKEVGAKTDLDATIDNNDATITVQSTADFASSGTIYIGTEAIGYTSTSATQFIGCQRGKWSPHYTYNDAFQFGHRHRVRQDPQAVESNPTVSVHPRVWIGKRVAVYMARMVGGVVDEKAEAQCVYSGRIAEIRDDVNSFATVLELESVLDEISKTPIGRDMYTAKISAGVRLTAGMTFEHEDWNGAGSVKTANALTVVSTTPGTNEIAEGMYSVEQIHSALESWWAAELAATRLYGTYSIAVAPNAGEYRTKIYSEIPGSGGVTTRYRFTLPKVVAILFGYSDAANDDATSANAFSLPAFDALANVPKHNPAPSPPLRAIVFTSYATGSAVDFDQNRVEVYDERGTFFDNYGLFPAAFPIAAQDTYQWGAFLLDDATLVYGAYDSTTGELGALRAPFESSYTRGDYKQFHALPWDDSALEYIEVKQIVFLESSTKNILASLLYSTGTLDYNRAGYDRLSAGFGLGIPGALLGPAFEASLSALPGSEDMMTLVVDKPTLCDELIGGDLVLRRIFPIWRGQGIQFGSWREPTTGLSVLALDDTNKAEPAGNATSQRSAGTITDEWARPIAKILYNRNFGQINSEEYQSDLEIYDHAAIDDAGQAAATFTVKARNTSGDILPLAVNFLATMPMFSRPARMVTRSIDSRHWQTITVGDVVLFSDLFARDPSTGIRGVSARPALVVKHRFSPGGLLPGMTEPADMGGEVTLFYTEGNTTLAGALYAPAADLDDTADADGFTSGYNSSTKTIRTYERRYNQSTEITVNGYPVLLEEALDASYFPAGYKVKVIERDPADPDAPQVWSDTVVSVSTTDIVLTTGLSALDAEKRYRVIFDDYDTVVTAQKVKAFQADDADGMVLNASQPYAYVSGSPEATYTANSATPEIELMPTSVYADGAGRDCGHDTALIRLIDNLADYKTAHNMPVQFDARDYNDGAGGLTAYKLVHCAQIHLTSETLSNAVTRELDCAPRHRSSDGTLAKVRVTLTRTRPATGSIYNVNRGAVYSELIRTTTSTTWQKASATGLSCAVKDSLGMAYLLIELSYKAECTGLHQCSETIRFQPTAWLDP